MYKLSEGALDKIMDGIDIAKPVIQILGHKKLNSSNSDRYRLLVSDGLKTNSFTMLATQLNHLITNNILSEYTVCEISKYALSSVSNSGKEKRVIIILEVEVIAPGDKVGCKIGNPINMGRSDAESAAKPNTSKATPYQHSNGAMQKSTASNNSSSEICTTPIAALSPYHNKWVIKARVLTKSQIRTWNNSRGEGKLFSVDLVDESGEIRCTGFNAQCDKFYDIMETGNVYYISRCTLKPANKQFNTMKNDFEMNMTSDTEVVPCHENNDDIPMLQFDFSPISQVENMKKDDIVDVLGVVTSCGDLQNFTSRTTGKELVKRDVNIVDDSGAMVSVTLWGKQAEEFDGANNPILALKKARIGEFNGGKNLSIGISTVIERDPDLPEAHKLRGWYNANGYLENAKSLSRPTGAGGGDINAPLCTFQEATDAKMGEKMDSADTYAVVATINLIRVENSIYKACPVESCKKKLVDQSTGIFRCEKCNKEYPNFVYRLLASMNIADATGNRWVTAFNEDTEKILGMSAQELGELKENDNDAYMQKFGDANFKRFTFGVRVKSEVFQDEMRKKHTCISVSPLNYKTHLAHLLNKVSQLAHIEKLES